MKKKPNSALHSVAEHFYMDAVDFGRRFELLWECGGLMHKMGRIKSFTDLLMGCECGLKSHALLSMSDRSLSDAYRKVRSCGHDINRLASLAKFLPERAIYDELAFSLKDIPIHIRYSLDAYEAFFPALVDIEGASNNYAATVGSDAWVMRIRNGLHALNDAISEEFSGELSMDFDSYLQGEKALRLFTGVHLSKNK